MILRHGTGWKFARLFPVLRCLWSFGGEACLLTAWEANGWKLEAYCHERRLFQYQRLLLWLGLTAILSRERLFVQRVTNDGPIMLIMLRAQAYLHFFLKFLVPSLCTSLINMSNDERHNIKDPQVSQ